MKKIGIIIGSLRKESFSKIIYNNLLEIGKDVLEIEEISIENLSMYNQDLDLVPPIEWVQFRDKVKEYDGIVFITPEYNRSLPAVIKNAIDIGSRPYGKSVWNGKVAGVISVSPGSLGGVLANNHLKQVLAYLNMDIINYPEVYIGNVGSLLNSDKLIDERTINLLKTFIDSLNKKIS